MLNHRWYLLIRKISNKEYEWKGCAGKAWENVYTFWHNSMKIRLLLVDNNKINQPEWPDGRMTARFQFIKTSSGMKCQGKWLFFFNVEKTSGWEFIILSGFVLWNVPSPVMIWNFNYKVQPPNILFGGSQNVTKINRIPTKLNASGLKPRREKNSGSKFCSIQTSATRWRDMMQNGGSRGP